MAWRRHLGSLDLRREGSTKHRCERSLRRRLHGAGESLAPRVSFVSAPRPCHDPTAKGARQGAGRDDPHLVRRPRVRPGSLIRTTGRVLTGISCVAGARVLDPTLLSPHPLKEPERTATVGLRLPTGATRGFDPEALRQLPSASAWARSGPAPSSRPRQSASACSPCIS
jgi:hypothetical protein